MQQSHLNFPNPYFSASAIKPPAPSLSSPPVGLHASATLTSPFDPSQSKHISERPSRSSFICKNELYPVTLHLRNLVAYTSTPQILREKATSILPQRKCLKPEAKTIPPSRSPPRQIESNSDRRTAEVSLAHFSGWEPLAWVGAVGQRRDRSVPPRIQLAHNSRGTIGWRYGIAVAGSRTVM